MPNGEVLNLMAQSGFSFIGTLQRVGASTVADIPIDEHTAIVRVDEVLHAPAELAGLAGSEITVQLSPDAARPEPGSRAAFFTDTVAFADSLAVREVERRPIEDVEPEVTAATAAGDSPHIAFQRRLEDRHVQLHAEDADAAVIGTVVALEKAGPAQFGEHDPDWWLATLAVSNVERGDVSAGQVTVLYANSLDVRWRRAPKPKAGQQGLWLLHRTEGAQRDLAPYVIQDPEDYQHVERIEMLRVTGGET